MPRAAAEQISCRPVVLATRNAEEEEQVQVCPGFGVSLKLAWAT